LTLFASTEAVAAGAQAVAKTSPASPKVARACPVTSKPGIVFCMALLRTDIKPVMAAAIGGNAPKDYGFSPSQLKKAYDLPASTSVAGEGVAIVDAYNDPNAVSDNVTYRSSFGLPACVSSTGAGCLTVLNQEAQASPLPAEAPAGSDWPLEESLDVDMVSAICPECHIYLLEAVTGALGNVGTAVNSAVKDLHVHFVSNSYGTKVRSTDPTYDTEYYDHPGVAVVASAGDAGYGVGYPAASQYVTSVGGTTLEKAAGTTRGWTETVWGGTGSGCAHYEPKPTWQTDTGCKKRTDNDVAAVGDPGTGVAVYDTFRVGGWVEVGGTSVSAPIITSVYALAGAPAKGTYPSSYPYADPGDLYDITTGNNGTCNKTYLCNAGPGYDGPSGLGTPDGIGAFTS
jgi:subtilase family serine protease